MTTTHVLIGIALVGLIALVYFADRKLKDVSWWKGKY